MNMAAAFQGVPPCTPYFPHPVSNPRQLALEVLSAVCPTAEEWDYCGKADFWAWSPKHSTALLKLSPTASRPSAFWQPSFAGGIPVFAD